MMRRTLAGLAIAALTACGGGGGSASVPSAPHVAQSGVLHVSLKVPAAAKRARAHAPGKLTPLYASPATQGLGITITAIAPAPAATPTPGPQAHPTVAFDLSTCTSGTNADGSAYSCTSNADGSRVYTLSTPPIAVGTYNLVVTTWDAAPASGVFSGEPLSDGSLSATVNTTGAAVNLTLNGIPYSVSAIPIAGQNHVTGNASAGYSIVGDVPTQWSIVALDDENYAIVGNGAPVVTVADSTNSFTITPVGTNTGQYTIAAKNASATSIPVSINATGLGPSARAATALTLQLTPVQEVWETLLGTAIYGFALNPPTFTPPNDPNTHPAPLDIVNDGGNWSAIGEVAGGNMWAYDNKRNAIVEYNQSSFGGLFPTGRTITTSAYALSGIAGDTNGFLYAVDLVSSSLLVWNTASPAAPLYTVPLKNAPGTVAGVSVVPNAASLDPTLPGLIMVGTTGGIEFYSNAKSGAPTLQGSPQAGNYGTTGIIAASIAPDTGTLWALDQATIPVIGVYSLAPGPSITALGTHLPSANTDSGFIAAGIANYAITSLGASGSFMQQYDFGVKTPGAITADLAINTLSSGSSYGLVITP